MQLELDHLFICVRPEAPEAELLKEFGLIEGRRRPHPGQGTTKVCIFFENAYLELLWLCNAKESQSPIVRPTGLWERCRWRETQACPFGIAFRRVASESLELPFSTWNYYAPFLPSRNAIAIATNSNNLAEPLIFLSPTFQNPLTESPPRIYRIELKIITGLSVTLPGEGTYTSPAMLAILRHYKKMESILVSNIIFFNPQIISLFSLRLCTWSVR
jgi:hypothetical protein